LPPAPSIQPTKGSIWFATGAPFANFTYTPIIPHANETVTFDASASTAGSGSIINYEWDFGDGTNDTGVYTTKIYTQAGNYTVILTVTDNEGAKDTIWRVITVILQPDGAALDLYTQKGGQGPHQPDGAFALGEKVMLIAFLTYNEQPVQNKLVGFEAADSRGNVFLDRSNFTDANGLATINFTIPVLCLPDMPSIFGTWTAVATSSVSEQNVSDTLTFMVRGPYIDLYTQKEPYDGKGPNRPSDAFAPQEEVILYAYASYSCEPVQNKPVGFEVIDPAGKVVVDRVAFTNSVGIANTSFRISWPCENPEETVFGTWKVIARVSISELTAEDTLTFEVGWIVEIVMVETVDATGGGKTSYARREYLYFNFTAKNIAFTSITATFTVAAYDEARVPIGLVVLHNWVIPSGTSQYFVIGLQIPRWAYIGVAIVYTNAYTNIPQLCGVPYCPEVSTTFMIQAS
jgi:PKD repeat protein